MYVCECIGNSVLLRNSSNKHSHLRPHESNKRAHQASAQSHLHHRLPETWTALLVPVFYLRGVRTL